MYEGCVHPNMVSGMVHHGVEAWSLFEYNKTDTCLISTSTLLVLGNSRTSRCSFFLGLSISVLLQASCLRVPLAEPLLSSVDSIAPRAILGCPQLFHLLYSLFELDVLALFVAMSLLL